MVTEWQRGNAGWQILPQSPAPLPEGAEAIWLACVVGLRDYVLKNRFPGVVLGLSGGIDSAVVAAMAVDAIGAKKVKCIMLPYRYTSSESLEDAEACARALGVQYDIVPIAPAVDGFLASLSDIFAGTQADVTEENLQSRTRGTILMAISNKLGPMVLTTGNKSEMSVGYATLYGDMNGGFNPIKDVYKTEVYAIAELRNNVRPKGCLGPEGIIIPPRIFSKAPSAELKLNQRDQDNLPPYDVLDDIIEQLVEQERSVADIVAQGHERKTVERVQHMLYLAEYKRRQAAPGVKITARNFGRDRRYPITNGFREKV
jgi:NAD+ synthase